MTSLFAPLALALALAQHTPEPAAPAAETRNSFVTIVTFVPVDASVMSPRTSG